MSSIADLGKEFLAWLEGAVSLPQPVLMLAAGFLAVFIASLLIFAMSKMLSRKDLFGLHGKKRAGGKHPFWQAAEKIAMFILQYLVLFPVYTLVWAGAFIAFLLLLTSARDYSMTIFLAIIIIAAIRAMAYVNQEFSEDLAKMLPLWLLVTVIIDPGFLLNTELSIDWGQLLASQQLYYGILFIIGVEWMLRLGSGIFAWLASRNKGEGALGPGDPL